MSLNPCFGGIWSLRQKRKSQQVYMLSLNPCFGGIWSLSGIINNTRQTRMPVLILVLVGYGL